MCGQKWSELPNINAHKITYGGYGGDDRRTRLWLWFSWVQFPLLTPDKRRFLIFSKKYDIIYIPNEKEIKNKWFVGEVLAITPACHAGDHGFEPRTDRQPSGVLRLWVPRTKPSFICCDNSIGRRAGIKQASCGFESHS